MNAVERVLSQLQNVRRIRDGVFRGNCPACGGKSGTKFSVRETPDGVLVHCFGGCSLESILGALGMRSAAELFDVIQAKPNAEALRQARIERGLKIWAGRRLTFVCRSLRELEQTISAYTRLLTEDTMTEESWDVLARLYHLRSTLDAEFHTLNGGSLQQIYDEIFRRLH